MGSRRALAFGAALLAVVLAGVWALRAGSRSDVGPAVSPPSDAGAGVGTAKGGQAHPRAVEGPEAAEDLAQRRSVEVAAPDDPFTGLRVRVLADGAPATGVAVELGGLGRTTDPQGEAIFPFAEWASAEGPPGETVLSARTGERGAALRVPFTPGEIELELAPLASLPARGVVLDADGRPAVGLEIATQGAAGEWRAGTTTDGEGRFDLAPLPTPIRIAALANGGVLAERVVQGPAEVVLRLAPTRHLVIEVQGPGARDEVTLEVHAQPATQESGFLHVRLRSPGPLARFELPAAPGGPSTLLVASCPGFVPRAALAPGDDAGPVRIVLEPARTFELFFPHAAGHGASARLAFAAPVVSSSTRYGSVHEYAPLDAHGLATFRILPEFAHANYTLRVPVAAGLPRGVAVLGGRLDTRRPERFDGVRLHPVVLVPPPGIEGPFRLRFELEPPPDIELPRRPGWSGPYGLHGAIELASDPAGRLELPLPPGRSRNASLFHAAGTRAIRFEVRGPGEVLLRFADQD